MIDANKVIETPGFNEKASYVAGFLRFRGCI
jgi:hypothetical protein